MLTWTWPVCLMYHHVKMVVLYCWYPEALSYACNGYNNYYNYYVVGAVLNFALLVSNQFPSMTILYPESSWFLPLNETEPLRATVVFPPSMRKFFISPKWCNWLQFHLFASSVCKTPIKKGKLFAKTAYYQVCGLNLKPKFTAFFLSHCV